MTDFEWLMSVLIDIVYVVPDDIPASSTLGGLDLGNGAGSVGRSIREMMVDLVVRVKSVRRFAVRLCTKLLGDESIVLNVKDEADGTYGTAGEVLWSAAWIIGEYPR